MERDDPLCTDVFIQSEDRAGKTTITAYFSSVPTASLDTIDGAALMELLKKIASEGFDMERMAMVIKRDRLKLLASLESKPADSFGE